MEKGRLLNKRIRKKKANAWVAFVRVVRPKAGDIVVFNIKSAISQRQLSAFRRHMHDEVEKLRKNTGIEILIMVLAADLDITTVREAE